MPGFTTVSIASMQAPRETIQGYSLQPRLRVFGGRQMVLGWGKIMLLELIRDTGSIAVAAQSMGISYNHAWTLLRTMNESFRQPLVSTTRGGKSKGGATLTEEGELVVEIYGTMIVESQQATLKSWSRLRKLLRPVQELPAESKNASLSEE